MPIPLIVWGASAAAGALGFGTGFIASDGLKTFQRTAVAVAVVGGLYLYAKHKGHI